jgi:hypothetical protein
MVKKSLHQIKMTYSRIFLEGYIVMWSELARALGSLDSWIWSENRFVVSMDDLLVGRIHQEIGKSSRKNKRYKHRT